MPPGGRRGSPPPRAPGRSRAARSRAGSGPASPRPKGFGPDGAVAGRDGEPVGRAGVLVDDDAARLDGETEPGGEVGAGHGADADDDDVGGQRRAIGELDRRWRGRPSPSDADRARRPAGPACRVARGRRGRRRTASVRHGAAEQAVGRLDDGHRGAERPGAGGDLEPDEAATHDDDLARGAELGREPVGVGEGAHRVDPVEVGALDRQRPVGRPGRQGAGGRRRASRPDAVTARPPDGVTLDGRRRRRR